MKLSVTSLNSGSNGNCYYIGNENEAVLIDAGISCREIEHRMRRLGLSMIKVKAIFISHEHSDHIKGVDVLSRKYKIPVYITFGTLQNSRLNINNPYFCILQSKGIITIGMLEVISFPKYHDAHDPHSFVVKCGNNCIGIFTDIGTPCEQLIKNFKCCNAIFLEANYDDDMLIKGNYPYYLKSRIRGGKGHLSNRQALNLFLNHKSDHLTHLFLSHISKENNDPLLVKHLFDQHARSVKIILTSRSQEIPVYEIDAELISRPLKTHFY